jgi:hypothetical protein
MNDLVSLFVMMPETAQIIDIINGDEQDFISDYLETINKIGEDEDDYILCNSNALGNFSLRKTIDSGMKLIELKDYLLQITSLQELMDFMVTRALFEYEYNLSTFLKSVEVSEFIASLEQYRVVDVDILDDDEKRDLIEDFVDNMSFTYMERQGLFDAEAFGEDLLSGQIYSEIEYIVDSHIDPHILEALDIESDDLVAELDDNRDDLYEFINGEELKYSTDEDEDGDYSAIVEDYISALYSIREEIERMVDDPGQWIIDYIESSFAKSVDIYELSKHFSGIYDYFDKEETLEWIQEDLEEQGDDAFYRLIDLVIYTPEYMSNYRMLDEWIKVSV